MQPNGPSAAAFLLRLKRRGFLDAVGDLWREHGDVFRVQVGGRNMIFTIHPDAVKQVNVSHR